jgi:hypothetical protein
MLRSLALALSRVVVHGRRSWTDRVMTVLAQTSKGQAHRSLAG